MSPPTVTTSAATSVAETTAVINGSLNPNSNATTYYFQYGTTTGYGSTTAAGTTNNGGTTIAETSQLTDLSATTTYHYRLVASNVNGTSYGADQSFTTASPPPPPPPPPAKPEAGTYKGKTSQHRAFSVHLTASPSRATNLSFGFGVRCTKHPRTEYFTITAGSATLPKRLTSSGFGLNASFLDRENWLYTVKATFTPTGTVQGTLSVKGRDPKLGRCKTGTVGWRAAI
jgi:hypothetical protein